MEMTELSSFALATLEILAFLFIFIIGASIIVIAALYIIDRTQTKQAIRHTLRRFSDQRTQPYNLPRYSQANWPLAARRSPADRHGLQAFRS